MSNLSLILHHTLLGCKLVLILCITLSLHLHTLMRFQIYPASYAYNLSVATARPCDIILCGVLCSLVEWAIAVLTFQTSVYA